MADWAMDWSISGTLVRLRQPIDAVAILNAIPFSTLEAPSRSSPAWRNAAELHLGPILNALEPGGLVWLGQAAADAQHAISLPTSASGRR
jgi:hypothetical protein